MTSVGTAVAYARVWPGSARRKTTDTFLAFMVNTYQQTQFSGEDPILDLVRQPLKNSFIRLLLVTLEDERYVGDRTLADR